MTGNGQEERVMQSTDVTYRPDPSRTGRLRKPPWRHRVGLGGRDKSKLGSLDKPWLTRTSIVVAIFLISSALCITSFTGIDPQENYETEFSPARHLLSANNTRHPPVWEDCTSEQQLKGLFIAIYVSLIIIFFIAIAIICDDFFVPSLEVISETLNLSEDVAGATFMAAGSSAPELFTSVIGVAFESDVGVGTIVGSAVFNILIIIALTAALAGQVLNLDWRPLIRDSIFYGLSIACFIGFSWDAVFTWWEALILLILYIIYLVLMKLNPWIMKKTANISCGGFCRNVVSPADPEAAVDSTSAEAGADAQATATDESAAANGNALPRKLPPLQHPPEPDRKISTMSSASQSLAVPTTKHIFHHHKHGELSSNFTSSNYDLKKLVRDTDSRAGSRPGSALSRHSTMRPDSQSSNINNSRTALVTSNGNGVAHNNNSIPMAKTNGSANHAISNNNNNEMFTSIVVGPNGQAKMKDDLVVGDVESLGGDSQGEFGSQTQLLKAPANAQRDCDSGIHSAQGTTPVIPEHPPSDPSDDSSDPKRRMSFLIDGMHHHHHHGEGEEEEKKEEEEEEEPSLRPIPCFPPINMYFPDKEILSNSCGCMRYTLKWVLFIISFPFMCLFSWTIPNCGKPSLRKYYAVSFTNSVLWIAILSFVMVMLVVKTGCLIGINDFTMGLVIVAVGTSVPDALSSILVARDGYGDMAVSNAIGSNVFDINLGMGLPFLIRIAVDKGASIKLFNEADMAKFLDGYYGFMPPHAKFGFILLLILFLTLGTFTAVRFRLNSVIGVSFAAMYFLFLIYAFIQELVCAGQC